MAATSSLCLQSCEQVGGAGAVMALEAAAVAAARKRKGPRAAGVVVGGGLPLACGGKKGWAAAAPCVRAAACGEGMENWYTGCLQLGEWRRCSSLGKIKFRGCRRGRRRESSKW